MATKTFNARFQFKGDTLANWQAANPVLLDKELAIVVVPAESGAVVQEPAVLFKVGDGTTAFNALPFVSAKAADVYDWAKAASKPSYTADEITGLADYIAGEIQDTDTQYKLEQDTNDGHILKLSSKPRGSNDWTVVATITTADTVYDDTTLSGRVTSLEGLVGNTAVATQIANAIDALNIAATYATKAELTALSDKVGNVEEGKTVVQMIGEAKTAASDANDAVAGRVSTLEGGDAGKSVRIIANEELAAQLIPEDAQESMDTLAEIAAWIHDHPDDAAAMNAAIAKLNGIVAGIGVDGEKATVVAYVTDAIAALNIGDYAKAADLNALAGRVVTVEGKAHEHANNGVLDGITSQKVATWDTVTSKANDADLAAIAKSGNVNDLVQTAGDVIVFNCGTATSVI